MRRILIDNARHKGRLKHGGQYQRVDLQDAILATDLSPEQLLVLDDAINKLGVEDDIAGRLVKLLCYAGLTMEQAANVLGVATATA